MFGFWWKKEKHNLHILDSEEWHLKSASLIQIDDENSPELPFELSCNARSLARGGTSFYLRKTTRAYVLYVQTGEQRAFW